MSLLYTKLAIDLMNDKIHQPRKIRTRRIILAITTMVIMALICACLYGFVIDSDPTLLLVVALMGFSWPYLLSISPYVQNAANYHIEVLKNGDRLEELYVSYKGRDVSVRYTLDETGKFVFADNIHKTNCVSYADGSKMPQRARYCVVNYLAYVLKMNELLSEGTTVSFE